ncbi:MAG TPA: VCBS repeat-containing protein [Spirochaetales bacterium]|nr:VCBS repeat-containing protein [Spirochaetales bacterium]
MSDTPAKKPRTFLRILGILLALVLLAIAVLSAVSFLDRQPITDLVPDGFSAYVRVASAGKFFESLLALETADALLAAPEAAGVRALVDALRRDPFLRSRAFRILADVRMDGALYGPAYLAAVDLGIRSALTRTAPFWGPWLSIPGLTYSRSSGTSRFLYRAGDTVIHAAVRKNLLVLAGDEGLLERALASGGAGRDAETAELLAGRAPRDLRILLRTAELLAGFRGDADPAGRFLADLKLPGFAAVDLSLSNAAVQLTLELPVSSDRAALAALISARSRPPAVLSVLPESSRYFSVLAAGSLEQVRDAALPLLGAEETWRQADAASKAALGMGLEDLLLSWSGDELGAFGLSDRTEPVFFLKVRDEARRRRVFQEAFQSGTLGEDSAAVLDGIRVPRIVFPWYIRALLDAAGADVPQPYFLVEDGYLLVSTSAESLVSAAREARAGKTLPRTDSWRRVSAGIPADAAAMIYYSLDRSVPFFLRGTGPLAEFLRRYGEGTASIRFGDGRMKLALSAVALGGRGTRDLPGFPLRTERRPVGGMEAGRGPDRRVRLYWMEEGGTLVSYLPASGIRKALSLDDSGHFVLETLPDGTVAAVWAVSRRGTVWRLDPDLAASEGFPRATGARPAAAPTLAPDPEAKGTSPALRLLVPLRDGGILTVSSSGTEGSLPVTFEDPVSVPISRWNGFLGIYPKSFDGTLWILDSGGQALPGWPVALPGIGYGSPVLAPLGSSFRAAFLTQAGTLSCWNDRGEPVPGFPVDLEGVFYGTPIFAADAYWAVSESGTLYRVGLDGRRTRTDVRGLGSREPVLAARDVDGDGRPEIFVSGDGNALYGFDADLEPLTGFPVQGTGRPAFADLNGDGRPELVSAGVDGTVRAVTFQAP